ncbi:Enhancer of polycomb-like transcription factor protein, putative isoform 2 [Hibiscus syriacus]|uniref:Enhancer of polycomb-like protein n=1 Tax=Hibiscus syriacus TaxID=106335 RepID=A0A6A2YW26_HIBSY|nr:uncharacterized protein LOC120156174 [Hibiscus syriacus]KAE8683222.1 Enhancer of polycomb-like transcription factor protein, putative isoform 2 [Hibiscus syriacus]
MPSVGMKRSTRVCRMKSSEIRILRSGRQLWPDSGEVNPKRRSNDGVEFNNSVKKTPKSEIQKFPPKTIEKPKGLNHEENPKKRSRKVKAEAINNGGTVDKMFGIVYTRKRKRNSVQKCQLSENSELKTPVDSTVLENDKLGTEVISNPSFRSSKLTVRSSIQKRRSSLRRMRSRNPFSSGALMSELVSSRRNGIPFSSVVSKNKLRSCSFRSDSSSNLSDESSSTSVLSDLMQKVELESESWRCSANVLIVEPNRCYREGAIVTLELSETKEWLIVVKKNNRTKYALKADKFMRSTSINRFTRSMIWAADDTWKLEFPNRQDWILFKDLYKECCERNGPASVCRVIPVPGVCEVSGNEGKPSVLFRRLNSYITVDGDEVSRALARRTASYDMDSEDEEWLKKFNNELYSGNGHYEHLSEDCFELMIDTFEKAAFCSPDDHSNVIAAASDIGIRPVVEAVHAYWLKKRDQRRSPLLRVFQGHQIKKAPVIPQPFLRKRRSFKRQASHGRGKQPSLRQAMAAEHDVLEEDNAMAKVEEARVAATRHIESAILKRELAQLLMQNADMATYKATMALRIAEAASLTGSSEDTAAHFLFDEVPVVV